MTARTYAMDVTLEVGGGTSVEVEVRFSLIEGVAVFCDVELYPFNRLLSDLQRERLKRRAAAWLDGQQGQDFAIEHVALREQLGPEMADRLKLAREAFIR